MHLCITFLLSAVVYSIGRISKSDLRTINFPDNIEGTEKLNGSLITEIVPFLLYHCRGQLRLAE